MSTELIERQPQKLSKWLSNEEAKTKIATALGQSMNVDYFISQMVIAFEAKDEIRECSPESKFRAANICAALGLLPTLMHVALIPRKRELTVMPQWQGYHTLFMRTGQVRQIRARLIHKLDEYEFDADTETVRHRYDPYKPGRVFQNFDDLKGGYIVFVMNDGRTIYHCVTVDTIRKARSCAQADNIWTKWFQEQCLKTLYRNAFARRVIHVDTQMENVLTQLDRQSDEVEENDPTRETTVVVSSASRTEAVRNLIQRPAAVQTASEPVIDDAPFETAEPVTKAKKQKPDKDTRLANAMAALQDLEPDTAAQQIVLDQCGIVAGEDVSLYALEDLESWIETKRGDA